MELATWAMNVVVDDLAARLDNGALVIYRGSPPRVVDGAIDAADVLVRVPLDSPAFEPAVDGVAVVRELPESMIETSGQATWAQWQTKNGDPLGKLVARAVDADDADSADMLLDRTDFQRGGLCIVSRATLSLPRTSV